MGIQEGAIVTRKGYKRTARVVRVLPGPPPSGGTSNNWHGWVELDKPLGNFVRWPIDALEVAHGR